jgi:hypothetical protein
MQRLVQPRLPHVVMRLPRPETRTEAQLLNVEQEAEEDSEEDSALQAAGVVNADRLSQQNMKPCEPQLPVNRNPKTTAQRIAYRRVCPES